MADHFADAFQAPDSQLVDELEARFRERHPELADEQKETEEVAQLGTAVLKLIDNRQSIDAKQQQHSLYVPVHVSSLADPTWHSSFEIDRQSTISIHAKQQQQQQQQQNIA